jgi:hypothetical protein
MLKHGRRRHTCITPPVLIMNSATRLPHLYHPAGADRELCHTPLNGLKAPPHLQQFWTSSDVRTRSDEMIADAIAESRRALALEHSADLEAYMSSSDFSSDMDSDDADVNAGCSVLPTRGVLLVCHSMSAVGLALEECY